MSTNITITSDDVVKSQVIGDVIAQALEDKGFGHVTAAFSPPFQQPLNLEMTDLKESRSVLDEIRDTYPDFLQEPVTIRAVPVMGLDPNYNTVDTNGSTETQVAIAVADQYSKNKTVLDTVVVFESVAQNPPKREMAFDSPEVADVMRRAAAICLKEGHTEWEETFPKAAQELEKEGKIKNAHGPLDVIEEHLMQRRLAGVLEVIKDETGYGSPGISEETMRLIREGAETKKQQPQLRLVDNTED